ncbi:ATP synthase protein I [Allgaiera indica]|uniref:ATP synthase protein I n=1 Tax=Allgaiera indica TaxID=765699 RepID=A0AAN4UTH5_9RHOB|nr:ATP synthase protein I [Allgaiera indica]
MKRLEERIAEAKRAATPKPKPRIETNLGQANYAWRMVTELVAGLGIGFVIGYALDAWLGTKPLFLVVFILLGFAAGVNVMLRTAKEMQKEAEKPAEREEG